MSLFIIWIMIVFYANIKIYLARGDGYRYTKHIINYQLLFFVYR